MRHEFASSSPPQTLLLTHNTIWVHLSWLLLQSHGSSCLMWRTFFPHSPTSINTHASCQKKKQNPSRCYNIIFSSFPIVSGIGATKSLLSHPSALSSPPASLHTAVLPQRGVSKLCAHVTRPLFITQSCQALNYFYCSPLNNFQSVTIFQVMWCP